MKILMMIILVAQLVACGRHDDSHSKHVDPYTIAIKEIGEDIQVPRSLFKVAEERMINSLGTLTFLPLKIILKEKNSGVLMAPLIEIELPKGGGNIDLAKYLGNQVGSFFLKIDFSQLPEDIFKVFYISENKRRRLDGELWGLACNKFADIISYYNKQMKGEGIKLNSSDYRHVSLIGGSFVFAINRGKTVNYTRVTFSDSRFTAGSCMQSAKAEE